MLNAAMLAHGWTSGGAKPAREVRADVLTS
jgi:hypothetical protein